MKKIIVAAAFAAAGLFGAVAPAQADTVGEVARQVCIQLDASPTVPTMISIVNSLLNTYQEADENKIMFAAMNQVCPEYKPIAVQAAWVRVQQERQRIQQSQDGINHDTNA